MIARDWRQRKTQPVGGDINFRFRMIFEKGNKIFDSGISSKIVISLEVSCYLLVILKDICHPPPPPPPPILSPPFPFSPRHLVSSHPKEITTWNVISLFFVLHFSREV